MGLVGRRDREAARRGVVRRRAARLTHRPREERVLRLAAVAPSDDALDHLPPRPKGEPAVKAEVLRRPERRSDEVVVQERVDVPAAHDGVALEEEELVLGEHLPELRRLQHAVPLGTGQMRHALELDAVHVPVVEQALEVLLRELPVDDVEVPRAAEEEHDVPKDHGHEVRRPALDEHGRLGIGVRIGMPEAAVLALEIEQELRVRVEHRARSLLRGT